MSTRRTFTWRRSTSTVSVSPSCTETTLPRTSAAAGETSSRGSKTRERRARVGRLPKGPPGERFLAALTHYPFPIPDSRVLNKAVSSQRRVRREVALDAREHCIGHLVLVGVAPELALLVRVADEGGLHQDRGDVGCFQHGEAGLLDVRLV